jgi:hypothetical protein
MRGLVPRAAFCSGCPLADSDDEVPIPRFPSCSALFLWDSDDELLILCLMLSCLALPVKLFDVDLPRAASGCGRCPVGYGQYRFAASSSAVLCILHIEQVMEHSALLSNPSHYSTSAFAIHSNGGHMDHVTWNFKHEWSASILK